MVGHWEDGEGEVALYKDRRPPPFRPGVVSFGIGPEFWWSDGVEFGGGWVSRVVKDEGVGLGLESEGVIFDVGWEKGDTVRLLAAAPCCRRLDCVNNLKKGLSGGERCAAMVDVSWGCLYSVAVRSLCRVWMMDWRRWRRHSVGLSPAKVGL